MTDTRSWLAERLGDAPVELRDRLYAAVDRVADSAPVHDQLVRAAGLCLRQALERSAHEAALELLAADALFTHACEAAAESGSGTLHSFTKQWSAVRFDRLLAARP